MNEEADPKQEKGKRGSKKEEGNRERLDKGGRKHNTKQR